MPPPSVRVALGWGLNSFLFATIVIFILYTRGRRRRRGVGGRIRTLPNDSALPFQATLIT